ncbi:MAG: hypothetical protein LBK82_05450 [Planctomycetaceae bacterium]|jgi:hypothetical protein|nr:hypothetical protein [Planctomycetaceae bacterium]
MIKQELVDKIIENENSAFTKSDSGDLSAMPNDFLIVTSITKMAQILSIWNVIKKPTVRHEELEGREYLVVLMSMILEGVHVGSQGAIYYSKDELAKTSEMWNMKPILIYHPKYGNTGTDLHIYKNQSIGMIMGTQWQNGKLKAEAWIDKEKAKG